MKDCDILENFNGSRAHVITPNQIQILKKYDFSFSFSTSHSWVTCFSFPGHLNTFSHRIFGF